MATKRQACSQPSGLIKAAVEFDRFALPGTIPAVGVKDRVASPVGDDEIKAGVHSGLDAVPGHKFTVGPNQHLLDTAGQMVGDIGNKGGGFLARNGGAFAQFADQILMGLFDKTQNRPKTQLAAVLGVVTLASALLVAVNCFDGGVDVDPDPGILQAAQLPDPFAQDAADLQDRFGLVDPQAVHIAPVGAGRRKPVDLEKTAEHGVQANVNEMPDSVEPYKQ